MSLAFVLVRTSRLPATGARVRVVGPYVVDLPRGWTEIHPVWSIEVLN